MAVSGSSPRLRGTFDHIIVGRDDFRFIPAPAGNICAASPSNTIVTVHPRACGEHL